MIVRVLGSAALLILLAGCAPARTALPTSTAEVWATETPRPSPWPRPSVTPWPTRLARWPTVTPWPTRQPTPSRAIVATEPARTPRATCVPYIEGEIDPSAFVPLLIVEEEEVFQDYVVRIYGQPCCVIGQRFEILKAGSRVYAYGCGMARIGSFYDDEHGDEYRHIPMGQDITGDGVPNLVIFEYSGGAHCCGTFHIFELGEEFRKVASFFVGDYGPHNVEDLDGDGNWEFVIYDWAYWGPYPPLAAPRPKVILHYVDGTYQVATELMRRPAPSITELQSRAQEFRRMEDEIGAVYAHPNILAFPLDLVYTGHADLVEPFLEMLWPDEPGEQEDLLQNLLTCLSYSLYVSDIKELNAPWPWPEDGGDLQEFRGSPGQMSRSTPPF